MCYSSALTESNIFFDLRGVIGSLIDCEVRKRLCFTVIVYHYIQYERLTI